MLFSLLLSGFVGIVSAKAGFRERPSIALHGRDYSGFEVPIRNDIAHQRYLIDITVGSPPQAFGVTVDTGSGDLWVPAANSTGCTPHCPPTFDPKRSRTYINTDLVFNASYGNGSVDQSIIGPYFNDTVRLSRAAFPGMTLGLGSVPPLFYNAGLFGIMGLGSPFQQTIVTNSGKPGPPNVDNSFPLVYDRLYKQGYISQRLFSLWLNKDTARTGSILFGATDRYRYTGDLQNVPVVLEGPDLFTGWAVNLTKLHSENGTSLLPSSAPTTVILDSGSPNMYLPLAAADAIANDLDATMYQGFPYVNCAQRRSRKLLTFTFGAARIVVRYGELIYPFGDPANIGPVKDRNGTKRCYLGVIDYPGPLYLLGATFQRSAYIVYDVDNKRVQLAQSRQR